MVVDDEERIRNGISSYFPWNELGFEITYQAENGQQAFDYLLTNGDIDVILCDIMMPVMTGLELFELLLKNDMKEIKVVILSGYQEFKFARKALQLGAKDYILKPTKYKELAQVFTAIKQELDEEKKAVDSDELSINVPVGMKLIDKIKKDVCENYRNITLTKAAENAHISPQYLSKRFKEKTGENFYTFLLRVRMEAAMQLILDSELCIYEISELVGYKNVKSFLRAFRQIYPQSPNEYRK